MLILQTKYSNSMRFFLLYFFILFSIITNISAQAFNCSTIKLENIQFIQNGNSYDIIFTLTGAPPTYNGHTFIGYSFYHIIPIIAQPIYDIVDCKDGTIPNPGVICTQEINPVCGCDGVTYTNGCITSLLKGFTLLHSGACTGSEKVQFKMKSVPPNTTAYFDPQLDYSNNFHLGCGFLSITTPTTQTLSCPYIKIDNFTFTPTGSTYTATFTLTGAPPMINGHSFLGYTFSNVRNTANLSQMYSISDCYDATLTRPGAICTSDYMPVCACNGLTYSNSCASEAVSGYSVGHTGECTGTEKILFKITGIPSGTRIDFDIGLKYNGYTLTGCPYSGYIMTPTTPPAPTCPDIKVENVQFTQNNGVYTATFTLTGAPTTIEGHTFKGYTLYNLTNTTNPSQALTYKNCYDATAYKPSTICTDVVTPVCACNGVTYNNNCMALYQNGYAALHTGACTGTEKIQFAISGITGANNRVEFAIKLFYDNYSIGNCFFSGNLTTPSATTPQPVICPEVKFENLQMTPNGSNYDATFTLSGATYLYLKNYSHFTGYTFVNLKNTTTGNQVTKITDCYDASLLRTNACNNLDFPIPVCGCDGVSYDDRCYASLLSGYSVLHYDTCTGKEKVLFKLNGILPGSRIDFDAIANYAEYSTSFATSCKYPFGFSTPPAVLVCNLTANSVNTQIKCGSSAQIFDLNANNSIILGNTTGTVSWYSDASAQNIITTPNNYSSVSSTVYAQISNSTTCKSNIISVQLDVRKPTVVINPTNVSAVCFGNSVTLTATGGSNYKWASGETTNTITVSQAGTYTVTVTDTYGCTNTTSKTLGVSTPPNLIIAGNTNLCPGFSTNLTAYGFQAYTWSTGSNDAGINITTPGNYSVTVTDNNGCKTSKSVTVTGLAKPEIKATGNILSSTYPSGNEWYYNGGSTGAYAQQYKALKSGNYQVKVTTNLCSFFSDIFSYTATASSDLSDAGLKIYPNPSTGQIFIETAIGSEPIKIKLINAVGQIVKSETLTTHFSVLHCEELPDGFYIINIDTGKKNISSVLILMK